MSDMMSNFANPLDSFGKGFGIGQGLLNQQLAQEQRAAEAAKQAQVEELMRRLQSPDATFDDYMKISMLMPKDQAEAIQKAATAMKAEQQQAALTDTSHIFAALRGGQYDVAKVLIQQQADAERASGNETGANFAETLAKMVDNPDSVKAVENMFGYQMAVLPGGKDAFDSIVKMEQERRDATREPILLQQKQAELDQAKTKAERDAIEVRYADAEKQSKLLLEESQTALNWANAWKAKHPAAGSNPEGDKLVNKAFDSVTKAANLASRASNLAAAIDVREPKGGWPTGAAGEGWRLLKTLLGSQESISALQQEYLNMRNNEALQMLPPGSASDKDMQIALEAFPPETASPGYLSEFMRGMAKWQNYIAEYNKVQLQWASNVGSMATSREPMTIDIKGKKVEVPAGSNFWDATKDVLAPDITDNPSPNEKPMAGVFSVTVGGKTYSFESKAKLDEFKKKAGING